MFFFFKQKTAYEIYQCDWSSDVCSSDLATLIEKLEYVVFNELVQSERIPKDLKNDEEDLARTVGSVKQAK